MTYYELYVIDNDGRSSIWSHTNGHRGKPCMVFDADKPQTIVLDHPTQRTLFYISAKGVMDIDIEVKPQAKPSKRKRPKRKR